MRNHILDQDADPLWCHAKLRADAYCDLAQHQAEVTSIDADRLG
jgi:hypothetical protein